MRLCQKIAELLMLRSNGKTLKSAVTQNALIVPNIDEMHASQRRVFMSQQNLVGGAANLSKEAATTVSTHLLKGVTDGNNPIILLMVPLKNVNSDRLKSTMIDSLKLANDTGFIFPIIVADGSASNVQGIRIQCSSKRT